MYAQTDVAQGSSLHAWCGHEQTFVFVAALLLAGCLLQRLHRRVSFEIVFQGFLKDTAVFLRVWRSRLPVAELSLCGKYARRQNLMSLKVVWHRKYLYLQEGGSSMALRLRTIDFFGDEGTAQLISDRHTTGLLELIVSSGCRDANQASSSPLPVP